ncbi:MAG: recombinase family protein, partial [Patescibacteria group bacterium]|nr:recombinase family protein [Patescibacteria group bacterium]
MLDRICAGEASGILAWHPDRLARNSIDGGKIIYLLDTGKLKDLKFPTFWFENTPQGKFMLSIAFGQSKYYVDNLSENIKRGHRQKLRKGIWPGFAPLGYLNNHRTKEIDLDKEKAPFIRKAFELYSTGEYTLKAIKQFLADSGIKSYRNKPLSISCVQRLLKNHFYYGVFKFNGEVYQGSHEPIISKKLFDSVQQAMNNRGKKKRKRKHEFAFSGLMRCGNCGCLITAETQKGHNYYRCTKKKQSCNERYLREENLIEQIKDFIQKVSLPDDWAKNMLSELDKEKEQTKRKSELIVQSLRKQKYEVEHKIEKLLDLYIDGGALTLEEYQTKKQKLLNEKLEIEQKIRDFEQSGNNWLEPMKKMIFEAKQAKILLSQGD